MATKSQDLSSSAEVAFRGSWGTPDGELDSDRVHAVTQEMEAKVRGLTDLEEARRVIQEINFPGAPPRAPQSDRSVFRKLSRVYELTNPTQNDAYEGLCNDPDITVLSDSQHWTQSGKLLIHVVAEQKLPKPPFPVSE